MGIWRRWRRSSLPSHLDQLLPGLCFIHAVDHQFPKETTTESGVCRTGGSTLVVTVPRSAGDYRLVWVCLDVTWPRLWHSLDRADDLLGNGWHGERKFWSLSCGAQCSVANTSQYAIYQSSIDYQTAAYGPYASSATGGNDLARDALAGIASLYSTPLYSNIPGRPLQYASTILACLAFLVTLPIYIVYWKGPQIRANSKFAQSLDQSRQQRDEKRRKSVHPGVEGPLGEKEQRVRRENA